ncbi:MAG: sulfite exporter TauE/SafE family protein [Cyanobacteria bacterium J06634_6]
MGGRLSAIESGGGEAVLAIAFLFSAALLAGAINVLAGGGGLLVFPALLLAGVLPISANATSAVGIWVGSVISSWAYRKELKPVAGRLWPLTLISLAGGGLGAWLLLHFSDEGFGQVVPYLVAGGTLLFAIAPNLSKLSATRAAALKGSHLENNEVSPSLNQPTLLMGQGIIATYGGFFGGGAGILMLTLLSLTNPGQLHGQLQTLQAVKLWMALCINAAAISYFLFANVINWPYAVVVALGTSLGGYSSVYLARRVSAVWLRRLVIAIGTVLSIYFFAATA